MSDALSLTLPKATGRTRARRRRPPIPPNWRHLAACIAWWAFALTVNLIAFVVDAHPSSIVSSSGCAIELQLYVRAWLAGGRLPPSAGVGPRRMALVLIFGGLAMSLAGA